MKENQLRPIDQMFNRWAQMTNFYINALGKDIEKRRSFIHAKKAGLVRIQRQFKGTKDKEDRATLRIINGEVRKLNRQLYPWLGIGRIINTIQSINSIFNKVSNLVKGIVKIIVERRERKMKAEQFDKIVSDLNEKKDRQVKSENTKRVELKRRHTGRVVLSGGISNGKKL
ncbi:hypothetical protein HGH92_26670 [Chitinophaga varians]|uniref:Uncharacterized protein n=1 Tax=Chitinophaga varians TaxID=2202339 RepID=A0A847S505_9BACT|nr:hypothetical protein [Chitinophaga varians]NLR67917.1 hypothetical protein [Chitinophaga varians]